eukprot:scaffold13345_cov66-Skeletonema_marinoi.AAC.1
MKHAHCGKCDSSIDTDLHLRPQYKQKICPAVIVSEEKRNDRIAEERNDPTFGERRRTLQQLSFRCLVVDRFANGFERTRR